MGSASGSRSVLAILAVCLFGGSRSPAAMAGSSPPAGNEESRIKVHGYLLGAFSQRTTGARPARGPDDPVLEEGRLRLDLGGAGASGRALFLVRGDVLYDAVVKGLDGDLREAYAGYASGPVDLGLGRQIVTWGAGDLFFISDVFPKDWDSFFSGRPMEYLKLGVDAFRIRYSSDALSADFLAIPFFTPDIVPSAERFSFVNPLSGVPIRGETEPGTTLSNTELALRLYRRLAGLDASLHVYRGFWRTPAVRLDDPVSPARGTRFVPELSVYAASAQRGLLGGVLSLEAGYYDSRQDSRGDDPAVPDSQWRLLAGYQRQPWEDFTIGVQGYVEVLERVRGIVSLRLTRWLDYQTWKLSLFAAYSPTDEDSFFQPVVTCRLTDALSASLGANVFGGNGQAGYFGPIEKSDNVFATIRFDF